MATRVRFAEYDFVPAGGLHKGKALCPFCGVYHSTETGLALAGDCPGKFARWRQCSIVVLGIAKGRAGAVDGVRTTPEGKNLERAVQHAIKAKYGG